MKSFPWYCLIDCSEPLSQGDILYSCEIVNPILDRDDNKIKGEISIYDIIVMSQSCDLENKKVDLVLVCPIFPLSDVEAKDSYIKSTKGKNDLRRGNIFGYHLLNKCVIKKHECDYLVVDFHNVFGMPIDYLISKAETYKKRLRLLPPYRERFSQAFASFFMRVGLPEDIPTFK